MGYFGGTVCPNELQHSPAPSLSRPEAAAAKPPAPCQCAPVAAAALSLHFRVHFYVCDPLLLRTARARHLYYLQLRADLLATPYPLSEEKCFVLAALALVADLGPYDPHAHAHRYFDPARYFPDWVSPTPPYSYEHRYLSRTWTL